MVYIGPFTLDYIKVNYMLYICLLGGDSDCSLLETISIKEMLSVYCQIATGDHTPSEGGNAIVKTLNA